MKISVQAIALASVSVVLLASFSACTSKQEYSTVYSIPGHNSEESNGQKYFYMTTGTNPKENTTNGKHGEYDPSEKVSYSTASQGKGGSTGHH